MNAREAVIEMMEYDFDHAELVVEILTRDETNRGVSKKTVPVARISPNYKRDGKIIIHIEQSDVDDAASEQF